MSPLQRTTILTGACVPLLAVGTFVALSTEVSPAALLIVTVVATAGTLALLFQLTRQHAALHTSADRILQTLDDSRSDHVILREALEQLPASRPDDRHVQVLRDLSERLATREAQLNDLVNHITTVMTALVHGRRIPSLEGLKLPTTQDRLVVFGSYREFLRTLVRMRKHAKAVAEVIRRVPVAVVVTSRQGKILSMNVAAEQLLGRKSTAMAGTKLQGLFANAPFGAGSPAYLLLVQNGEEAVDRLRQGEQREVFTTIRGGKGQIILVGVRGYFGKQHVLIFRERNPKPQLTTTLATKDAETVPTASLLLHEGSATPN